MTKRLTIEIMVKEDLGYCCLWFFFTRFRRTEVIADRLGVTKRAVKYRKQDLREGRLVCEQAPNCMKACVYALRLPQQDEKPSRG